MKSSNSSKPKLMSLTPYNVSLQYFLSEKGNIISSTQVSGIYPWYLSSYPIQHWVFSIVFLDISVVYLVTSFLTSTTWIQTSIISAITSYMIHLPYFYLFPNRYSLQSSHNCLYKALV